MTLIEYSAYFGSNQIFNYLKINDATASHSNYQYTIHSRSEEMFILLEQDFDLFLQLNSEICLRESIKSHNNQIANYIIE